MTTSESLPAFARVYGSTVMLKNTLYITPIIFFLERKIKAENKLLSV